MASLSLFVRRAAMTATSRRIVPLAARGAGRCSAALSTKAYKINDVGEQATHMQDEFAILDKMLEDGLAAQAKVQDIKANLPLAVDAPDGESDGHLTEELQEIQAILEDVAAHKEEINARLSKIQALIQENNKIYAVDSPDGETDGHLAEEMEEINHIIDDAAKFENKDQIEYQHKMEDAVRKDRIRDPEHDW